MHHGPVPGSASVESADGMSSVEISANPIPFDYLSSYIASPEAGAISTFIGVTRNNFQGKEVLKLEYEAYEPMALKKMMSLCSEVHTKWPDVIKIGIAHRVGRVVVGEPSVVIAVSSAHRKASLEACAWAIDELKATVPIWKKEFFADGSIWKENEECRILYSNNK